MWLRVRNVAGILEKGTKGNISYELLPDVAIQISAYIGFTWRVLRLKLNRLLATILLSQSQTVVKPKLKP